MITDRIGLHSVLLPLLIANFTNVEDEGEKESENGKETTQFLLQKQIQIQANSQMINLTKLVKSSLSSICHLVWDLGPY